MGDTTFPLDVGEVQRRKLKMVLESPLTWGAPVPVVAGWALFGLSSALALSGLAAVCLGLSVFWWKRWGKVDREVREKLVAESNEAQNNELSQIAASLGQRGFSKAQNLLNKALTKKWKIEEAVHGSQLPWSQRARLDTLVDTVCFSLVGLLQDDPGVEQRETVEAGKRALVTLEDALDHLPDMLNPIEGVKKGGAKDSFQAALSDLSEEVAVAKAVKARLKRDFESLHGVLEPHRKTNGNGKSGNSSAKSQKN